MDTEVLDARTITEAKAGEIAELLATVWPSPRKTAEYRLRQILESGRSYAGNDVHAPRSFVIRENGKVIAHAAIVPRTIGTSDGDMVIAGLARVCTDPTHRGRGLGEIITRAALQVVDSGDFRFALFQTSPEVRPFYEKIGACEVENKIVNSLAEDPTVSPFWDHVAMRYPNFGDWPTGEVDLRGPGY